MIASQWPVFAEATRENDLRRHRCDAGVMRFLVLGPLRVEKNGGSVRMGGQRQRSVLVLLLLNAGHPVSIDLIASEIWPDQALGDVRDSLYTYVSQLRRALGRDRIVRTDAGYLLHLTDDDEIDALTFEGSAIRARRLLGSDPAMACELLASTLDLWRGLPYQGFENLGSPAPEATRLEEMRLSASEDHIEAVLASGGTPSAGDVAKLCDLHPHRERLWGLRARSLYRAGRQAEALRTFSQVRAVLRDESGLDVSPELARLEEKILLQDPSLDPDAPPPPTNLPLPVSSFVGRLGELTLLDKAIHEHRLVTVIGPGGAGKTRLAIEAAHKVVGTFPDGVWFVDLAQVADPEMVAPAVASGLQTVERAGLNLTESLGAYLRARTVLLVLDNCEHVVEPIATLATSLLTQAPSLSVLATSRQPLGADGEVLFALDGLSIAPGAEDTVDAERLFEVRAAAVHREFRRDETNRASVESICRHLDGIPLAIELAAAQTSVLSPSDIERHLAERFALLDDGPSPRFVHRSLRASMNWSYDLLSTRSRQAFDTFGVFEGPFSAAAAGFVQDLQTDMETIGEIRCLVEASLLQPIASPQGTSVFRMLETTRHYARDHLVESGQWEVAVERHDSWHRDMCRQLRPAFFGRERIPAQQQIQSELADSQVAFDRLLRSGDVSGGLDMAWSLGHVWFFSGRLVDGERRLTSLLGVSTELKGRSRADTLTIGSLLALYRQRFDQSIVWVEEAIEIYRSIADEQGLAYALARRGHVAFVSGDGLTAMAILQESLDLCREIGFADGTAWPLTLLAQARRWSGDESARVKEMLEDGRRRFIAMGEIYGQVHADMILATLYSQDQEYRLRLSEEMVRLGERPGADRLIQSTALHSLAYAVWDGGDFDRAEGLNRAAARSALETGATVNTGLGLLQAASFAGLRGQAKRAATLFGAGDTHFVMQKASFQELVSRPAIESATDVLGTHRYRRYYEEGTHLNVDEATALLLAQTDYS